MAFPTTSPRSPGSARSTRHGCTLMLVSLHSVRHQLTSAFGGFAAAVPELKHLCEGMDQADSITLDGELKLVGA